MKTALKIVGFLFLLAGVYQLGRAVGRSVARGTLDLASDSTLLISGVVLIGASVAASRLTRPKT